jgi:hypothetical protein
MNEDKILEICKRVINQRNINAEKWVKETLEILNESRK